MYDCIELSRGQVHMVEQGQGYSGRNSVDVCYSLGIYFPFLYSRATQGIYLLDMMLFNYAEVYVTSHVARSRSIYCSISHIFYLFKQLFSFPPQYLIPISKKMVLPSHEKLHYLMEVIPRSTCQGYRTSSEMQILYI